MISPASALRRATIVNERQQGVDCRQSRYRLSLPSGVPDCPSACRGSFARKRPFGRSRPRFAFELNQRCFRLLAPPLRSDRDPARRASARFPWSTSRRAWCRRAAASEAQRREPLVRIGAIQLSLRRPYPDGTGIRPHRTKTLIRPSPHLYNLGYAKYNNAKSDSARTKRELFSSRPRRTGERNCRRALSRPSSCSSRGGAGRRRFGRIGRRYYNLRHSS